MRLTVFDLETTGVNPETCRIVTAYIGVMESVAVDDRGREISRTAYLLDPGIEIPAEATAIHGITTDRARTEGTPAMRGVDAIEAELYMSLAHTDGIVAFNAAYDLTVLDREVRRHLNRPLAFDPTPVIDPYVLDKAMSHRRGKRTLSAQSEYYHIPFDGDAHDAGADARMAGMLAFKLLGTPKIRDAVPPSESLTHMVHRWSIVWRQRQQESLADYFRSIGADADNVNPEWPMISWKES